MRELKKINKKLKNEKKYKRLKKEYIILKQKRSNDKEKITLLIDKVKKARYQNKTIAKEMEQKHHFSIVEFLNKLNQGLGQANIDTKINPEKLSQNLDEIAGELNKRLLKLKNLEKEAQKKQKSENMGSLMTDTFQSISPPSSHLPSPDSSFASVGNSIQEPTFENSESRITDLSQTRKTHQDSLLSELGPDVITEVDPVKLNLEVDVLKKFEQTDLVGKLWTLLAMKDESNYLIGSHQKGLILVKNGEEVYKELIPLKGKRLWDMVYARGQDCYFFCHSENLWKKTNDGQPPSLFLSIEFGYRIGGCMDYSFIGGFLVVSVDKKKLSIIDLDQAKSVMRIPTFKIDYIKDFQLFGPNLGKIAYLTEKGSLGVSKFDFETKTGSKVCQLAIKLRKEWNEEVIAVHVCSNHKIALISLARESSQVVQTEDGKQEKKKLTPIATRFFIFEIRESSLVSKACLGCFDQEIGRFHALNFYDYIGERAIFVGLSSENGDVHLFEYNTRSRKFKERETLRISCSEYDPVHIRKLGSQFYYTGRKAKLVRLSIKKAE